MDKKTYIQLLKQTGKALKEIREDDLRANVHPSAAIEALSEPFQYAISTQAPRKTSGLVEYQRLLKKMYK